MANNGKTIENIKILRLLKDNLYEDESTDEIVLGGAEETNEIIKKRLSRQYKITLTEFWNSGQRLAIQCETWAQSVKLLEAFDKLGEEWRDGDSYLYYHSYMFGEYTCYTNNNTCGIKKELYHMGYHIYKFKNVDLDN